MTRRLVVQRRGALAGGRAAAIPIYKGKGYGNFIPLFQISATRTISLSTARERNRLTSARARWYRPSLEFRSPEESASRAPISTKAISLMAVTATMASTSNSLARRDKSAVGYRATKTHDSGSDGLPELQTPHGEGACAMPATSWQALPVL